MNRFELILRMNFAIMILVIAVQSDDLNGGFVDL